MKILVADDDSTTRHIVSGFLRKSGHEVVLAGDGNEAVAILQSEDAPSLAIVDWIMPGLDGIGVCKQVRARSNRHYTYLICLTSKAGTQYLIEALEAGFDDYLSKPVSLQELSARLLGGRRIIELQEKLLLSCEVMKFKASHDLLTGAWNRGGIVELLDAELARCRRNGMCLALLMVDVDHFKTINDTYGHIVGDQVLKHLAQVMTSSIRGYDWLGRYGGEEFLIVAPECSAEGVLALAERLRKTVAEQPLTVDGYQVRVTISLGLAVSLDVGPSATELVQAADAAVYRAKQAGRNRVEMHGKSAQAKGGRDGSRNLLAPAQPEGFGNIPGATRQERRVSWSVVQLPPFSPVATRVLRLVSRSDASLQKLAELISADPTFSSELLTIVNSALYGQRQPIKDIQQATSLLGLERVKGLAVTVGVRSYFGSSLKNPALQCCWRHSLACAIIAEELAGGSLIDRGAAYTAGILHDIGRVALAVIQPEPYMQFLSETPASPQEILQRERELFEVDHCEAGRRLIHEWNLPDEFLDITSRHHVASEDGKRGKLDMLGLVHFSCMLADTLGFAAVRPLTLRNYQELVSELPEQTQRRFCFDPKELTLKIDTKIKSVASA